jgi:hypothetical protein
MERETAPKKTTTRKAAASEEEAVETSDQQQLPSPTEMLEAMRLEVLHQVEVRPYTTVLVAAGLGYVLGAGAPRWATGLAWTLGSRAVLARIASSL